MEENMSEWKEFTAKTVDEALTSALVSLETTSDKVEYEVIEKESSRSAETNSLIAKVKSTLEKNVVNTGSFSLNTANNQTFSVSVIGVVIKLYSSKFLFVE